MKQYKFANFEFYRTNRLFPRLLLNNAKFDFEDLRIALRYFILFKFIYSILMNFKLQIRKPMQWSTALNVRSQDNGFTICLSQSAKGKMQRSKWSF